MMAQAGLLWKAGQQIISMACGEAPGTTYLRWAEGVVVFPAMASKSSSMMALAGHLWNTEYFISSMTSGVVPVMHIYAVGDIGHNPPLRWHKLDNHGKR